jgi:hypothetical protein
VGRARPGAQVLVRGAQGSGPLCSRHRTDEGVALGECAPYEVDQLREAAEQRVPVFGGQPDRRRVRVQQIEVISLLGR